MDGVQDVRYSFSFRRYISNNLEGSSNALPIINLTSEKIVQHKTNVVLVSGDSYTARLDAEKLGKGKKKVVNISKGGNTIKDVIKSLETFAQENHNANVQKLFICIGTNDIRHAQYGIRYLKRPYINMIKTAKKLFPNSKIFCQSLLPLPIVKSNTVRNVESMNCLIYEACTQERVFYLNVFGTFLDNSGTKRHSLFFPRDITDIHPNKRGIGLLAKFYIHIIHTKTFNPLGY